MCPETARLPQSAAFTLHGSRGLAGGYRPDSDADMCLIVDVAGVTERSELATLLRSALDTTLEHGQGAVEADLAAAYDRQGCVTILVPGTSIDIPVGTAFQYRNISGVDFKFICIAMPPWPGDSEATFLNGKWQPTI